MVLKVHLNSDVFYDCRFPVCVVDGSDPSLLFQWWACFEQHVHAASVTQRVARVLRDHHPPAGLQEDLCKLISMALLPVLHGGIPQIQQTKSCTSWWNTPDTTVYPVLSGWIPQIQQTVNPVLSGGIPQIQQKCQSSLLRRKSFQMVPSSGQNVAVHASPAASNYVFLICALPVHSTSFLPRPLPTQMTCIMSSVLDFVLWFYEFCFARHDEALPVRICGNSYK